MTLEAGGIAVLKPGSEDRRLDLDWLRIGAFMLLILYHVGMFYVPWDWHVKSDRLPQWLEPVMVLTNPWRLTLLFIVSGAATRFMSDKLKLRLLAWTRTGRLAPPILFGMAVIVPPQTWLEVAQAGQTAPLSYLSFWWRYLLSSGGWVSHGQPLTTPTWNHLWFVVYLLAYTLLLALALAAAPGLLRTMQRRGEGALEGVGLLLWPALLLVLIHNLLAPNFPQTHAFVGDWTVHAESGFAFLFGYLFARSDTVWLGLIRWRRWSTAVALLACSIYAGTLALWIGGRLYPDGARLTMQIVHGIDQWACVAALLGLSRKHLSTLDHPARRYLTEAIFPYYIVHQTLIVSIGWFLLPLDLTIGVEAIIIVAGTAAGCAATFEIVRRVGWLRPLFGLRLRAGR